MNLHEYQAKVLFKSFAMPVPNNSVVRDVSEVDDAISSLAGNTWVVKAQVHAGGRGLFGKKPNPQYLEQVLKDLSLWEKKDSILLALSGGMKRRVLIAKALAHEPMVLFLDEPTAGVDVELRKDMWALVKRLRESGVTIILTTHYIEEAEAIADRVGVINNGELLLVDDKEALMHKLGKRQLIIELETTLTAVPEILSSLDLELSNGGSKLIYTYDPHKTDTGINELLAAISDAKLLIKDVQTTKTSLEEIFVNLLKAEK